jgi:adenylate cyclase
MIVGGIPLPRADHAEAVARIALEMLLAIDRFSAALDVKVRLRIGLHTGSVVAGVIGKKKFTYDLWGNTVNVASRMESHGESGKVHVSNEVYEALKDTFVFEERGEIEVKGKGVMHTYFLTDPLP